MTLLTICQSVAADIGVTMPRPPMFGSQVPVAQRMFAQARRAAQSLYRRAPWVELVTEYTFTASGVSDYPLPADFGWMVDDTLWERSRYWQLRGAMSPQKWQLYKSSIYGRATIWRRWRIRLPSGSGAGTSPTFSIDPQISSTDDTSSFVFEYVSKNWCISNIAGVPQAMASDWTSDNDDSVLDEWLIELDTRWRMLRRLGLAYDDDQDEAEREIDKAVARNGGGAILDLVPAHKRDDFIGQYTLGAFPPVPPPDAPAMIAGPRPRLPGSPAPPSMPLVPVRPAAEPAVRLSRRPQERPPRSRIIRPGAPGIRPAAAFAPPLATSAPGPLLAPAPAVLLPVPVAQGTPMPVRGRIDPRTAWPAPASPAPPSVLRRPPGQPLTPLVPRGRRFPQPPMSDA
jgi:hypothetical protein